MTEETPAQTPEGRLIEAAAKATGRSVRSLAANAGMSDTRWRHVVKGWQPGPNGQRVPVRAPAFPLARMAAVVGVSAEELTEAGRDDAAKLLPTLNQGLAGLIPSAPDTTFPATGGLLVGSNAHGTTAHSHPDEIDLIYASNMPPKEKLLRIRQVLQLRAQVEAEENTLRLAEDKEKAPADEARADESLPENQQS